MERNILEEIAERYEISYRTIARQIDYDIAMVSRVKNRQQKMSVQMAYNIHKVYGYNLDEILEVEDNA